MLASIQRVQFLADLPADDLAHLGARCRSRTCTAGEVILERGDATRDVYLILSGAVRVVVRTIFGYEAILNDLGPGMFFGELAAIDDGPRSASVTALMNTRLCVIPGDAFMEFVLSRPELARRLMRMLTDRVRAKDEKLIEFSVLSVRQRLIAELLRLSRERADGERVVSPPPPQRVLAARIGTRRESVSRELMDLARAGLVAVGRQAIVIHVPDRLRAEVQARE